MTITPVNKFTCDGPQCFEEDFRSEEGLPQGWTAMHGSIELKTKTLRDGQPYIFQRMPIPLATRHFCSSQCLSDWWDSIIQHNIKGTRK